MSKFFMYMAWIQALFATVAFAHGGHAQQLEKVQIVNVWQNIPLKDAFRDIQNQTDFFFTYDSRQIKEVKISSVEEKLPLLEVLKYISSQTGLSFSIKDQLILVDYDKKLFGGKELAVSEIILPTLGKLQEVNSEVIYMVSFEDQNFDENIKGQVNDKYGNPLVGATVVVKETGQGTVTDVDGTFSVAVPNAGRVTLVVSYVGFTTKEVSVSRTANINITLDQNVSELEEIVVTALGVSKEKKALAYSIQGLDNEEFNQSRNGDLISQLSGRVPGLSILQNPSGVASSSRITLRGSSSLSLGSNQPLFVVDGVPISNDINSSEAAPSRAQLQSIDFGNSILDLNPDDIASINVLKGPNAAALYGSRAANGAIIITTRSAENGKGAVVEVNTGITFEEVVRDWDFQNQFSAGSDDVYRANWGWNWGVPLDGTFRAVQPESPLFPEEDVLLPRWNSNDFWETGVAYNNNISVALGGEKNSVRFSVTNLQKTGIIPNNDYSKTNFSINTRSQLSDQWSLDIVGNYVKTGSDNISSTRYSSSGIMYSFVFAHANADLGLFKEYWAEGQEGVQQRYYQTWADNPFFIANEHINSFEKDRFFGNAKLNFELNENFKFHTRIGTDVFTDNQFSRRPYSSQWFPQGMYQENSFTFQETNIDFLATYNKSFENNIGLNISVGANSFQQDRNRSGLFGNSLAVPNLYNPGNIAGTPIVSRTNSRKRINSVYGNLELSFSNAIYLTATGRNDWSSTLPVQNNSYFYPSVGASIVLSELIELPSIFSYAKLRSSWAQVGSDTDPFLINRSYDFGRLPSSVQN
ncbi:MAG: SusC/RagA family TonB-linked outer membrane protein, partial [Bacteroidota bacterium]